MLCECVLYEPQSAALVEKKGLPITWAGESWFATCAHTFEASFCPPRQGYVRGAIRFQGLLGTPRSSRVTLDASTKGKLLSQSGTRLTFLANIDFGNIMVTSFVNSIYADFMKYPLRKVLNVEKRFEKPIDVGMAAKTQIKAMEEKMAAMQADFDAETARLRRENEEMRAKLKGGTPSVDSVPRSLG